MAGTGPTMTSLCGLKRRARSAAAFGGPGAGAAAAAPGAAADGRRQPAGAGGVLFAMLDEHGEGAIGRDLAVHVERERPAIGDHAIGDLDRIAITGDAVALGGDE